MQSYNDTGYDSLENALAPDVAGLLRTVRVNGERSNANQVSSAGARTVYQIIPETRARIMKSAGFDPWSSPENAVRGAAIVAGDALRWAKGDPAKAAGYYHAGGNTAQWGPKTAAYMQRTGGSMNPFDQFDAPASANPFDRFDSAAPAKKPPKAANPTAAPADPLEGYGTIDRAIIGAGKAATDFLHGIGVGDMLGLQRGDEKADARLMGDTAGVIGNALGQAGIMYTGGKGLQLIGRGAQAAMAGRNLTQAGQAVAKGGQLLQKAGNAVVNPANYKQAVAAGAGFGAVSQPGDLTERVKNAGVGAAGGALGLSVGRGIGKAAQTAKALLTPSSQAEAGAIAQLSAKGIDFNALPRAVQKQIVDIGKRSTADLGSLDGDQLSRMADFEALGIKPTRGWVTRDAKDWWLENNLNTVNDQVAGRFKDANQSLLQAVRAGTGDATDYQLGRQLGDTLTGYDASLKANADQLYQAARGAAGRDIPLDPHRFVNAASTELDQQMLGSKLPSDTLGWFQKVTDGREPFDMGTALQRLQALNGRLYGTHDPAEAKALGIVKRHLTDAIEGYGGPSAGGLPRTGADPQQDLAKAFRQARGAAADRFRFQESSPLVDKVLKGQYTPEKLPDLIGGMKVDDLSRLAGVEAQRGVPVMSQLRDAARAYVRDASTLQGETGGSFTVAGLRKALDKIGPEKGRLLFGDDGWAQYQRILRSAGAINNAPLKPAGSSTVPNMLRMLQRTPIPGASGVLNMFAAGAGKAKQMADVGRALNPSMRVVNPSPAASSQLPLLSVPGLLTWEETQR